MQNKKIIALIFGVALITSCVDKPEDTLLGIDNEVVEFVWGGLNSWYFWQGDVTELADNRFPSLNERNTYLNGFSDPSAFFKTLQHADDRFSGIVIWK